MNVLDYAGQPLLMGSHVRAWQDGVEYTAKVDVIFQKNPPGRECGARELCPGHHHILLIRDSDGVTTYNTSDAVVVIS